MTTTNQQRNSFDPSLENFVEGIIQDSGLGSMSRDAIDEARNEIMNQVESRIKAELWSKLSTEQQEELVKLLESGTGPEETNSYMEKHIPEIGSVLAQTLYNFKQLYI